MLVRQHLARPPTGGGARAIQRRAISLGHDIVRRIQQMDKHVVIKRNGRPGRAPVQRQGQGLPRPGQPHQLIAMQLNQRRLAKISPQRIGNGGQLRHQRPGHHRQRLRQRHRAAQRLPGRVQPLQAKAVYARRGRAWHHQVQPAMQQLIRLPLAGWIIAARRRPHRFTHHVIRAV